MSDFHPYFDEQREPQPLRPVERELLAGGLPPYAPLALGNQSRSIERPAARPFVRQMFTLPNNPLGWFVLALIRAYANRRSYAIQVRGRGTKWWVRLHDRLARRHNARVNARYMALAPEQRRITKEKWWRVWVGSHRQSIPPRFATKLGIYFNRRPCTEARRIWV